MFVGTFFLEHTEYGILYKMKFVVLNSLFDKKSTLYYYRIQTEINGHFQQNNIRDKFNLQFRRKPQYLNLADEIVPS